LASASPVSGVYRRAARGGGDPVAAGADADRHRSDREHLEIGFCFVLVMRGLLSLLVDTTSVAPPPGAPRRHG
jgi:hypothetical protein